MNWSIFAPLGRNGQIRPSASAGAALLAGLALALFIAAKAADLSPLAPVAAMLFMVLPAWLFVNRRVEISLAVLIVYLGLLDGYIKLSTSTELATLGRDVLLYAIALGMLARTIVRHREVRLPPLTGWVLAWTLVVLVQLLNPNNGSWLHSVASLRQHIEFVPLFFIGFAVMTSIQRLRGFLVLLLAVAAVNGAVAVVQSGMSPDELARWGPGYALLVDGTGGAPRTFEGEDGEEHVRPPGLGSDAGSAGVLGAGALPAALALLMTRRRGVRVALVRSGLAVGTVMAVVAVVTSQSRGVVIIAIVSVLAFAALVAASRQAARIIAGLVVAGALTFAAVSFVTDQDGGGGFRYESIAPGNLIRTTVLAREGTYAVVPDYAARFPFGAGIGSTGPAAGVFGGSTENTLNAESQYTFMIVEVGVGGLLLLLAFMTTLLVGAVKRLRRLRDQEMQLLLAAIAAPLFGQVATWTVGGTTATSPTAPYLWFVTGILSYWLWAGGSRARSRARTATP